MLKRVGTMNGVVGANISHVGHASKNVRLIIWRNIQPDFFVATYSPFGNRVTTTPNVQ
jgi:hypothetical protein